MKSESVDIAKLSADPSNVRSHDARNLSAIKASLQKFGQQKPIVVNAENVVVAGNGTLAAAQALGWEKIGVVRSKLKGAEATAYAIADNRTAELAEWDDDALAETLAALQNDETIDELAAGFTGKEIEDLINQATGLDVTEDVNASVYGGATAMSRSSAPMRFWLDGEYVSGDVLDFGCGNENLGYARYDAFKHPDTRSLLADYDTVLCNYVLNVQPSDHLIVLIAGYISRLLRPGGKALFAMRSDMEVGRHVTDRGVQVIKSVGAWSELLGAFSWVEVVEEKRFIGIVATPMRPDDKTTRSDSAHTSGRKRQSAGKKKRGDKARC